MLMVFIPRIAAASADSLPIRVMKPWTTSGASMEDLQVMHASLLLQTTPRSQTLRRFGVKQRETRGKRLCRRIY